MRWQFEAEAGATGHALTTGREEYEQTGDVPDQAEPRIEVHGIDVRSHPSQHSDCTSAVAPQHRQLNSTGCNASARRAVLSVGAVAMTLLVIAIPFSDNPAPSRSELLMGRLADASAESFYDAMVASVNRSVADDGDTSHLSWSKNRVRSEVYELRKRVRSVIMSEYKHHNQMKAGLERSRATLKGDIMRAMDQTTTVQGEVRILAEEMGSGMANLNMAEREMRRRIEAYKKHYDRDLARIHAILSNQTLELEQDSRDDLERMYKEELQKMQDDTDRILAEDRATMTKNDNEAMQKIAEIRKKLGLDVSTIKSTQAGLSTDLQDVVRRQADHLSNMTRSQHQIQEEVARITSAMKDVQKKQADLRETAKGNFEELGHADSQLKSAVFKLDMLEKKLLANQKSLQGESDSVQQKATDLEGEITKQLDVIENVKNQVEKFAAENPEFRKQVETDHEEMQKTIENLRTEINKVDAVKKQIGELQTLLDSKINDMSSQLDDISGQQQIQNTALGQQGSDLQSIMGRIEGLTKDAETLSKSAKDEHDGVAATIAEMQGKLTGLLGLKDTLASVQTKMEEQLTALSTQLNEMHTSHNKTSLEIQTAIAGLKASLAQQVKAEQGHYTAADASLHTMQKDIDDLDNYKVDASKMEKELVKQLQDTTQSLGILDAKFSGKSVDLNSQVEEIRNAINKVPTKTDFNASLQHAMDKADKTKGMLDALGEKVRVLREDQDRDSNSLAGISTDVQEQGDRIDENWKKVKGTLAGEGDVLAKISHKLKDDDLSKDVDRVFDRAPGH